MAKEKFQLKDGVTMFYDDESDLKVLAGKSVELDEEDVTPKTATAIMSGALVKVKVAKQPAAQNQPNPKDDKDKR